MTVPVGGPHGGRVTTPCQGSSLGEPCRQGGGLAGLGGHCLLPTPTQPPFSACDLHGGKGLPKGAGVAVLGGSRPRTGWSVTRDSIVVGVTGPDPTPASWQGRSHLGGSPPPSHVTPQGLTWPNGWSLGQCSPLGSHPYFLLGAAPQRGEQGFQGSRQGLRGLARGLLCSDGRSVPTFCPLETRLPERKDTSEWPLGRWGGSQAVGVGSGPLQRPSQPQPGPGVLTKG